MLLRCTRQGQLNLTGSGCHLYFLSLSAADGPCTGFGWKQMDADPFSHAFLTASDRIRRDMEINVGYLGDLLGSVSITNVQSECNVADSGSDSPILGMSSRESRNPRPTAPDSLENGLHKLYFDLGRYPLGRFWKSFVMCVVGDQTRSRNEPTHQINCPAQALPHQINSKPTVYSPRQTPP